MDEMNEYKMDADNTSVEQEDKLGSFSDLLGDGHAITIVTVKKLDKHDDTSLESEDAKDDDVQDNTRTDTRAEIEKIIKRMLGK